MKFFRHPLLLALLLAGVVQTYAHNTVVTYQGRVTANGTTFSGAGLFKFALVTSTNTAATATATAQLTGQFVTGYSVTLGGSGYLSPPAVTISGGGGSGATATAVISGGMVIAVNANATGSGYTSPPAVTIAPPPENIVFTTYWSNDGTSSNGNEPAAAVGAPVTNGLFTLALGDASLANMATLGAELFAQPNLQLRIWFNDGANGFAVLHPPQALTAVPYARHAANLSGSVAASQITGALSSSNIGTGTITGTMLAPGTIGAAQLAAGAVTTAALADGAVTAAKVGTASDWIALTIANPTPTVGEQFGSAVAALGDDRVLVGAVNDDSGAENAGAAYLFSLNGALLTTFNNPTPASLDQFGYSVAAVGSDRVLIGAFGDDTSGSGSGAAYLFGTNGALITTFNNPTPDGGESFGWSVAAMGNDRVVIGTPYHFQLGAGGFVGAAYLFSTNGALLTTFTNPTPAETEQFGVSVAAVGTDRVLIGADQDGTGAVSAGAAYLFSTNGALLATFTSSTPSAVAYFGRSVAAVGSDKVLIGEYAADTGAADSGAAHLFSTNGTLITTFTNPMPANSAFFGAAVSAAGTDRVLIGASTAQGGGAAYLFSTDGALLTAFTNPTPASGENFGWAVAPVGASRVLIAAINDNTAANGSGAAYLFTTETYIPGLVADAVKPRSITTASLEDGAVTAAKIGGVLSPSQIPSLDASIITTGTLADDRLSTGIPRKSGGNAFVGQQSISAEEAIALRGSVSGAANLTYMSFRDSGGVRQGYVGDGGSGDRDVFLASDAGNVVLNTVAGRVLSATSGGNVEFLNLAGVGWGNRSAQIIGSSTPGANFVRITTSDTERLRVDNNGNVGIGTTSPGFLLHVNGSAGKPGGGSWSTASDARLKKNIRPLSGALEKLLALRGVNFEYTAPENIGELSGERTGLLAQDVEKVFPDWVETAPDGYKRVTVRGLEALVVEALRQLRTEKDAEIDELKKSVLELKSLVNRQNDNAAGGAR